MPGDDDRFGDALTRDFERTAKMLDVAKLEQLVRVEHRRDDGALALRSARRRRARRALMVLIEP
jgi:hypothetical protein